MRKQKRRKQKTKALVVQTHQARLVRRLFSQNFFSGPLFTIALRKTYGLLALEEGAICTEVAFSTSDAFSSLLFVFAFEPDDNVASSTSSLEAENFFTVPSAQTFFRRKEGGFVQLLRRLPSTTASIA